jgi:hypothetical protein
MPTKKIDLSEWKLLGQFPKKEFTIADVKKAMKKIAKVGYKRFAHILIEDKDYWKVYHKKRSKFKVIKYYNL